MMRYDIVLVKSRVALQGVSRKVTIVGRVIFLMTSGNPGNRFPVSNLRLNFVKTILSLLLLVEQDCSHVGLQNHFVTLLSTLIFAN